jgi:heme a synthase
MQFYPTSSRPSITPQERTFVRLAGVAMVVTLCLLMLGAWVRLTDAGLGCPDWPGCYGHFTPTQAKDKIQAAVIAQGGEHGPVSIGKAWNEMLHRYVASFVGLLIVLLAFLAWKWRLVLKRSPLLPTAMVGVVMLQGLFGKWTVTLLLKPAIVTGHLLGGVLTFSLLVWLWERQRVPRKYVDAEPVASLHWPALVGIGFLALQIFLGGWTSTNYAALACTDLPTCQGSWWPAMNFSEAFHLIRELGQTGEGTAISMQSLTAIHFTHRLWALIVTAYLSWLAWRTFGSGYSFWDQEGRQGERPLGLALFLMLCVQVGLGLSNIVWSLPLPVAVAHNGGAAVLMALLIVLSLRAARARLAV